MGITSFGQKSDYYYKVTFEMTKVLTDLVYEINPNSVMTYVSGEGTSKNENSKIPWAQGILLFSFLLVPSPETYVITELGLIS